MHINHWPIYARAGSSAVNAPGGPMHDHVGPMHARAGQVNARIVPENNSASPVSARSVPFHAALPHQNN